MLLTNQQIFVVEDNMQNRVIFNLILIKQGAQVHFDRWGNMSLIQLASLPRMDVIILDLMLAGGISGLDVFDKIRAQPEYQAIPIVAVSATDPSTGIPQTKQKGFAGFIAKPVEDALFAGQIASIIAGEQVWYAGARAY